MTENGMILEKLFAQLGKMVSYVHSLIPRGIAHWDGNVSYEEHARVIGSDGKLYKALQASTDQDPQGEMTDPRVYWDLEVPETSQSADHNVVACGKILANGNGPMLTPPTTAGVSSASWSNLNNEYNVNLPSTLNKKAIAIAQPVRESDDTPVARVEVTPGLNGFDVSFYDSSGTAMQCDFLFIVVGM